MTPTLAGKRVLVTGASGFVGAALVHSLSGRGAEVIAGLRATSSRYRLIGVEAPVRMVELDLLRHSQVQERLHDIRPHYVFNCVVNRDYRDRQTTVALNTTALVNLVEAARHPNLRGFVHCGSSLEYGAAPGPYREEDPLLPGSFFGAAKGAGTLLLQSLARLYALPLVILRLFQVYGPGEPKEHLIPTAIRRIPRGEPIPLTKPGMAHDPVYIDDVVRACLLAAQSGLQGEVFNIAGGRRQTNEETVQRIADVLGQPAKVETGAFPARDWDHGEWFADIGKAAERLGWFPATRFDDGVRATIAWQQQQEAGSRCD